MYRIKELRKEKGISQRTLATDINVSQSNICGYENGTVDPTGKIIIALANYFDVTTDYLLGIRELDGTATKSINIMRDNYGNIHIS